MNPCRPDGATILPGGLTVVIRSMPIYEYACTGCGHEFELLVLPSRETTAECPACHGLELERLTSGFAVSSPEMSRARVTAARRQFQRSKDQKDKQVADAERVKAHRDEH